MIDFHPGGEKIVKNRGSSGVILTGGLEEDVTTWRRAALLVELYRKAGIEAAAGGHYPGRNRQMAQKKDKWYSLAESPIQEAFTSLLKTKGVNCDRNSRRNLLFRRNPMGQQLPLHC